MKKQATKLGLIAALIIGGTTMAQAVVVNGGKVRFVGDIVNAACAVDASSMDQTVVMGQVRTARLMTAGQTSSNVPFNIVLNDCDSSVSQNASISFTGATVSGANNALAVSNGSSAGAATNVGIQILDNTGTVLKLDGSQFSSGIVISDGRNVIPFNARYLATGVATAGTANAEATFSVQYQ
ncbi:type 1 fimbrial major subunit FimA [Providencia rettgeri]